MNVASAQLAAEKRQQSARSLCDEVTLYLRAARFPPPVHEWAFHPHRKWRLDMAWPNAKVGLEVDGGIYTHGAHNRGARIEADHEKRNAALALGWAILTIGPVAVRKGTYIEVLKSVLVDRGVRVL